jgi:molecular chaperone DnaK
MQRIREAAEVARIELSTIESTEINLPFLIFEAGVAKSLQRTLTRAAFEASVADLIAKVWDPVETALRLGEVDPTAIDGVVMVGGMTRTPMVVKVAEEMFEGISLYRGVNPDEVVAIGAALQAGIITREVTSVIVLDRTPLALGISVIGDLMAMIVERNTTVPAVRTQPFTTTRDYQESVGIDIYQGESEDVNENELLGAFSLLGLQHAKKGVPMIDVTFTLDVNQQLDVIAVDRATHRKAGIKIEHSARMPDADVKAAHRRIAG